jgi:hypothetical protein
MSSRAAPESEPARRAGAATVLTATAASSSKVRIRPPTSLAPGRRPDRDSPEGARVGEPRAGTHEGQARADEAPPRWTAFVRGRRPRRDSPEGAEVAAPRTAMRETPTKPDEAVFARVNEAPSRVRGPQGDPPEVSHLAALRRAQPRWRTGTAVEESSGHRGPDRAANVETIVTPGPIVTVWR